MSPLLLRWAGAAAVAAGLAAQALLQVPLEDANRIRGTKRLHTTPSSLAFRLSAGGVKEAAADALWLRFLPKLGQPWLDVQKKAAWIEGTARVLLEANPRAHFPLRYAAYFLEFQDDRHPGIERLMVEAMEITRRGPFGTTRRPNRDAWVLPETVGMNLVQYGKDEGERARGMAYLRKAASLPGCPTLILEYVGGLEARRGNPLQSWELYLYQAATTKNPVWRKGYLEEADRVRARHIERWAAAHEERTGKWPGTREEVLEDAPPVVRDEFRSRPAVADLFFADATLVPGRRQVEIPAFLESQEKEGLREIRFTADAYRSEKGAPPPDLDALQAWARRVFPPPPRHGTRWELDPATGHPRIAADVADPRLRRPAAAPLVPR